MLEFVKTFDLLGSVTQFLLERRQSLGISDDVPLRPRLVNQEKGGLIIYTWNDHSEDVKSPVTHVGVYDPSTQVHKVLWIYNQKVRIVSCSLNRERTLLGFTIVTRQDTGQDGKSKDLYQAFLAELQSLDTRVFSLNLQRHAFLKVQFLYPDASPPVGSSAGSSSSAPSRHSYMIIMLHKESVGLYQIPMARIGDRGIMMSGQPCTEQILRKFVWCQWDTQNQRLYYIHNVRQNGTSTDSIGHKLSAIQFHSGGKFDNMIDVPINFPFPYIRTSTRNEIAIYPLVTLVTAAGMDPLEDDYESDEDLVSPTDEPPPDQHHRVSYADIPLHPGIPDSTLSAVVLSQTNGSMCLCYQEYISSSSRPKHTTSLGTQADGEPETATVDVNYFVCMIHHAKTLHGCATGLPRSMVTGKRITFHWFGEYLTVIMPGVFCHLLNVSLDFEPCHHILLHNQDIPTMTRPPVPTSATSSTQHQPAVTSSSSKSSTATSTDTSDPTHETQGITAMEMKSSCSRSFVKVAHQSRNGFSSEGTNIGTDRARAHNQDSAVSSCQPSQGFSPPPVPSQDPYSSSSASSLLGPSMSPRARGRSLDLADTVSVTGGEGFSFGMPLVPCFGFFRETGSVGLNLYDASSGHIWRLASDPDALLQSFRAAYWSTQLAILHYLIMLRTRDLFTIKRVFEALTANPVSPENNIFLSEYLVASTYASMRKMSDKETLELLPFTAADTFRGQFEKNVHGERLARVTYTSLDSVNISTKGSQERRRRSSADSWDLLRRSLRLKQIPPPSRFSHDHVLKMLQKSTFDDSGTSGKKWTWMNQNLEESFFSGMHTVRLSDVPTIRTGGSSSSETSGTGGGRHSRTETVLGATPLFLQANQTAMFEPKKRVAAATEQLLVNHLVHHLKKESRIKAQNIAREYIASQIDQCQQLCHLLWSIHTDGDTTDHEQLLPNLQEVGTDKEYQLLQMYERLFLVTEELAFPRPLGFSSYFTSLGFKCLNHCLFLQYVDRRVMDLTPDFVLQLLRDLPDDADENCAQVKFDIISRLPKPFADDCFQRWHHPFLVKSVAQQQVANILQEGMLMKRNRSDGSSDAEQRSAEIRSRSATTTDSHSATSAETASFKPLANFIKHLEDTAMEIQRQKPGSVSLMYDTNIIDQAALSFTRHHGQHDLSQANF